eukprot:1206968-Amphidinium_carterae.1
MQVTVIVWGRGLSSFCCRTTFGNPLQYPHNGHVTTQRTAWPKQLDKRLPKQSVHECSPRVGGLRGVFTSG